MVLNSCFSIKYLTLLDVEMCFYYCCYFARTCLTPFTRIFDHMFSSSVDAYGIKLENGQVITLNI